MPRLRGRKFTGLSLIEQQHVLALRATAFRLGKANRFALLSLLMAGHLAGEHTALDGSADGVLWLATNGSNRHNETPLLGVLPKNSSTFFCGAAAFCAEKKLLLPRAIKATCYCGSLSGSGRFRA